MIARRIKIMINNYLYKFKLYIYGVLILLLGSLSLFVFVFNRASFWDIAVLVIPVFKNDQLLHMLESYLLVLMGSEVVDCNNFNRVVVYA